MIWYDGSRRACRFEGEGEGDGHRMRERELRRERVDVKW